MLEKKNLILHMPILHRGYLEFLESQKDKISAVYIIDEKLQKELSEFNPDIAAMSPETIKGLLEKIGFQNIAILTKENIKDLGEKELLLVQDEISRNLYDKYLSGQKAEWASVFLRWDKSKVLSEKPLEDIGTSKDDFDYEMMEEARKEAQKTGDWWRKIGAVLVKDKEILIRGCNRDLPSDHTPYQMGEVRDFFKAGEKQELASTIHAEQNIIARAAKEGISLKGTSLYVTTFPCPVCAKLIACSGIKNLYFSEGGSNFDAKKVLDSAGVRIIYITLKNINK